MNIEGISTPKNILERRIGQFARHLSEQDIDMAIIRHNADLFYFTGTVQDAHLVITSDAKTIFLVWRSLERARQESPLDFIVPLDRLSRLAEILEAHGVKSPGRIGLEMDVLPTTAYRYYSQKIWPKAEYRDISVAIRELRKKKEPIEIEKIEQACNQADAALSKVPEILQAGMTELELAALVELELRKRGHPGLLRMRIWNQEIGMGQIVSGKTATLPSWTNTPVGGMGPHPAFGMGASFKKISRGEVVSIDIGGWSEGYCCDITRPFVIGRASQRAQDVFSKVKELMDELYCRLVPGTMAGELYEYAIKFMGRAGLDDHFMGIGADRVPFIGHGLGIELDEFPFIAKGNRMEIEPWMVIAMEPKVILPDIGVIGLEDTFVVDTTGARRLTCFPQKLTTI